MDLFEASGARDRARSMPLASKLRPAQLEAVYGQEHLLRPDGPLSGPLQSAIFFGPPGTGKTTVARILAQQQGGVYIPLSATEAGVAKIKAAAEEARERWNLYGTGTVVFIDEIHRLNRAQQDALLPILEEGTLTLIGATTENPWATLNPALISRCRLMEFHPLTVEAVRKILEDAFSRRKDWWREDGEITPDVLDTLAQRSAGDARAALKWLENLVRMADAAKSRRVDDTLLEQAQTGEPHYHDREGDRHYDLISAFIKSIRGSDPDAALYWFGRMLAGGEDPLYVMRRVIIHAAEDVGLADPTGLLLAQAAMYALEHVGLPEARIPMAEAVLYLALAPKSNSVVEALARLDRAVTKWPQAPVPDAIKDRNYRPDLTESYRYPHHAPGHFLPDSHLPPQLEEIRIYEPGDQGEESRLASRLESWRAQRAAFLHGGKESPERRGGPQIDPETDR